MRQRKPLYEKALGKLNILVHRVAISLRKARVVDYERELQRAMRYIQIIKRTAFGRRGDKAMVEAYRLYSRLQRLSGLPQFFSDSTVQNPDKVVPLRKGYHTARPSSVRWDAKAMMAAPKEGVDRKWWRPPKRVAKVKTFTQQEIEDAYPGRVYKRRESYHFSRHERPQVDARVPGGRSVIHWSR